MSSEARGKLATWGVGAAVLGAFALIYSGISSLDNLLGVGENSAAIEEAQGEIVRIERELRAAISEVDTEARDRTVRNRDKMQERIGGLGRRVDDFIHEDGPRLSVVEAEAEQLRREIEWLHG